MHFSPTSTTAISLLNLVPSIYGSSVLTPRQQPTVAEPASVPFGLTYLFTAYLSLGKPLAPIVIPGGVLIAEPITNGTVTGPSINATIIGGIATPAVYNNMTLQVPKIQVWGLTSDGVSFVINELGVGKPKGQVTRIVCCPWAFLKKLRSRGLRVLADNRLQEIDIGGGAEYQSLRDGYILASINPNAQQTEVAVHGYLVENTAMFS